MGNCFRKRNNKVGQEPDTSEILSNASPFRKPSPRAEKTMVEDLAKKEQDPITNKGGLSFTIDYMDGQPNRMPSRLADRLDGAVDDGNTSSNGFVYTAEERELMAELYRVDIMREKREKAMQEDIKVYDAALRRRIMAEKTEAKLDRAATPDITERRMRVKQMADEARAASRMGKSISYLNKI